MQYIIGKFRGVLKINNMSASKGLFGRYLHRVFIETGSMGGDYFNIDGIFQVKSVREIIRVCNHINSSTYDEMLPAIEDNHKRSFAWGEPFEMLKEKIKTLIQ